MRPTRHQMFLEMARAASRRGTCYRLNVGAVVVDSTPLNVPNVLGIGYNGAPSGEPHCTGNGCQYFTPRGCRVVHAETNALERATHSTAVFADLYVTHSPCGACVQLIADAGTRTATGPTIRRVFFETAYRDPEPIKTLIGSGKDVYQILPSGLVVDQRTGEIVEL